MLTPSDKRAFVAKAFHPHGNGLANKLGMFAPDSEVAEAMDEEQGAKMQQMLQSPAFDDIITLARIYTMTATLAEQDDLINRNDMQHLAMFWCAATIAIGEPEMEALAYLTGQMEPGYKPTSVIDREMQGEVEADDE